MGGEEEESRMGCPVHHINSEEKQMKSPVQQINSEDKQMKSSMIQEERARSPPQKRSSGEFGEELAKRQRRFDIEEEDQTEREEKDKREKEEEDKKENEENEGQESPEKRLKLSVVGERLAALANQSLAQPPILNNQSLAQPPISNNQSLAPVTISNSQSFPQAPTSNLQVREESKVEDQKQQGIEAEEDDKGKERATVEEVVAPVNKEMIPADADENFVKTGEPDSVQSEEAEMSKPMSSPARTSSPARSSSPTKMTNPAEDDTVVSIFKELETRQRQKQEEVDGCKDCNRHHGGWKLLGFNDQVSFFSLL